MAPRLPITGRSTGSPEARGGFRVSARREKGLSSSEIHRPSSIQGNQDAGSAPKVASAREAPRGQGLALRPVGRRRWVHRAFGPQPGPARDRGGLPG